MIEATYRRVQPALYGKAWFRRLSDDGKYIVVWLISGPLSMSLSGVIAAGLLTLAEKLGWPVERVRVALDDLVNAGVAELDVEAPLIFLPFALANDPPANWKVACGWARIYSTLPECDLRDRIGAVVEATLPQRDAKMIADGKPESARFFSSWRAVVEPSETQPEGSGYQPDTVSRRSRTTDPSPVPEPEPEPKPVPANRAAERRDCESFAGTQAAAAVADGFSGGSPQTADGTHDAAAEPKAAARLPEAAVQEGRRALEERGVLRRMRR